VSWEKYWPVEPPSSQAVLTQIMGFYYYAFFPRDDKHCVCPLCGGNWTICNARFTWADDAHNRIIQLYSPCKSARPPFFRYVGLDPVSASVTFTELLKECTPQLVVSTASTKKVRGPHMCNCSREQIWAKGCTCNGL
jgi:hypothetical protein